MSLKKRVEWVDILKGIAIICVFIGHTTSMEYGNVSGMLKIWIYSFHMPLFFFLSGYVFFIKNCDDYKTFLKKKIKSIIIPLISFSVISVIFDLLYYTLLLHDPDHSLQIEINKLIGIFTQQKTGEYNTVLWFLPCLFVVENIFYWIIKFTNKYNKTCVIYISALCIYFVGVIYIKTIGILLPWCIETSMIAILFMSIGYLMKINKEYFEILNAKWTIVLFAINIIVAFVNYSLSGYIVDLNIDAIGNPLLFPVAALSGILGFVTLFKNVKKLRMIKYIGRNSLMFYGLNGITVFVPNIIIYNILKTNFVDLGNLGVIFAIFYAIVQCIVTVPIVEIINRKMRFLLGDFSKIKGKKYE